MLVLKKIDPSICINYFITKLLFNIGSNLCMTRGGRCGEPPPPVLWEVPGLDIIRVCGEVFGAVLPVSYKDGGGKGKIET